MRTEGISTRGIEERGPRHGGGDRVHQRRRMDWQPEDVAPLAVFLAAMPALSPALGAKLLA
ncbi:MAG: hypothetical protein R2748_17770 [Bryobacterales bacterium]